MPEVRKRTREDLLDELTRLSQSIPNHEDIDSLLSRGQQEGWNRLNTLLAWVREVESLGKRLDARWRLGR